MVQIGESVKKNSNGDTGSNNIISSDKTESYSTARVDKKTQYCITVILLAYKINDLQLSSYL